MKLNRKIAFMSAVAATMSAGAMAQAVITVQPAPPAAIVQTAPAPREGFTWIAPHWTQRADGTWAMAGGAWVPNSEAVAVLTQRDRDRDGTPDVADDDKDNDGVPNRYDSHPNNRWRD